MFDNESSIRINLLRFPLTVGVLFHHSYETSVRFSYGTVGVSQNTFISEFVRNLISQGLCRMAPPLFFLLSGYLFFAGFKWSEDGYLSKLKRRVRTLLIPLLFWNIASLSIFVLAQTIPATQIYVSFKLYPPIKCFDTYVFLSAIFGIGINRFPIAYQFWFIRDLMILCILSPAVHFINKKIFPIFFTCIFFCWFLNICPNYSESVGAILFFCLGAFLSQKNKSLFAWDRYGHFALLLYFPILLLDAAFYGDPFTFYLHKIGIFLGVLAALYITKNIAEKGNLRATVLGLSGASFFVFAAHEPLLTICRKLVYRAIAPDCSALVLALYFAIPILVIFILLGTHRLLLYIAPEFLKLITGGRHSV